MRRRALATSVGVASVLWIAPLVARADVFSFGAGVALAGGYAAFDEPDPNTLAQPKSGADVAIPRFSGIGYGAGIALEGRLFDVVGLEVSGLYVRESMSGDVQVAGSTSTVTITQPTVCIPILVKGVLPIPIVAPFAELGPELVITGLSDVEVAPGGSLGTVASADDFSVWAVLGLGVELKPPIPGLDLRFPVALRLGVNPSSPTGLGDRAVVLPSDAVVLDSTPSVTLGLTTGASVFF